jgi:hypothetical protein
MENKSRAKRGLRTDNKGAKLDGGNSLRAADLGHRGGNTPAVHLKKAELRIDVARGSRLCLAPMDMYISGLDALFGTAPVLVQCLDDVEL